MTSLQDQIELLKPYIRHVKNTGQASAQITFKAQSGWSYDDAIQSMQPDCKSVEMKAHCNQYIQTLANTIADDCYDPDSVEGTLDIVLNEDGAALVLNAEVVTATLVNLEEQVRL